MKIDTPDIVINMAAYILIGILGAATFLVVILLARFEKLKSRFKPIIKRVKKSTFWNNTIQSITFSYLDFCIVWNANIKYIEAFPENDHAK